jgi:1,4-alpha-glucan branching enzyme
MQFVIYFESATIRDQVMLHAWDPGGDIRDFAGTTDDHRHFRFDLDMDTTDSRDIAFKFWFPLQTPLWEPDDYIRRMPANAQQLWTFDFSARYMTKDPGQEKPPAKIAINVITRSKFKGGSIFVWKPGSNNSAKYAEISRDDQTEASSFSIPVQPWMKEGFNFKLVSADQSNWEPDTSSRVWRPADGAKVWIKGKTLELFTSRPVTISASIELTYMRTLGRPSLRIADSVWDYQDDLVADPEQIMDGDFAICKYNTLVYPDVPYRITASNEDVECLNLPYTLHSGQTETTSYAVAGVYRWLAHQPKRDATLELEVRPNPNSNFDSSIQLAWRPGQGPRTARDSVLPACLSATATRTTGRNTGSAWKVKIPVFSEVPHWIDILSSANGMNEARADGDARSKRVFELKPGETRTMITGDGLSGLGNRPPEFQDLDETERRNWMKRAFTSGLVDSVFAPYELPHGATKGDQEWLFVLFAPHAVSADVLVLDTSWTGTPRRNKTIAMKLTDDLRYWWARVPLTALPDPNDIRYRFLLNDTQEVLDPASRSLTPAQWLLVQPGEGAASAWSVAVDTGSLRKVDANGWQTPYYNEFIIYELHPNRFTKRNFNEVAFDRLSIEVGPNGYLGALGVNALELLPIHEFPKDISWGYNPSCFFAIEQSYGGPERFSQLVTTCHHQGKAVMIDVVYNHIAESPMQEVAADVYVDGETNWGDMVNYDHPMCREFFRQAYIYLWDTFRLDGFRFDATEAIVNGHVDNGYIIRDHCTGSGGGFEFLVELKHAVEKAANVCGRRWPYRVCENDPCNDGLLGQCVDGEWDFRLQYPLGAAAVNREDKTPEVTGILKMGRALHQVVRYVETHDAVSGQEDWKQRVVRREAWGCGMSMAKAMGATALLAEGVPMLFMGEEAAEDQPFYFNMPDLNDTRCYLDLNHYLDSNTDNSRVLEWFKHLIGLRRNLSNGFTWDDEPKVGRGYKTLAFTRAGEKYFVITTFGTSDTQQNLGWLGLPSGGSYKEIFNSTWPAYRVASDSPKDNGGYSAGLTADKLVQLPPIGAVVLERA